MAQKRSRQNKLKTDLILMAGSFVFVYIITLAFFRFVPANFTPSDTSLHPTPVLKPYDPDSSLPTNIQLKKILSPLQYQVTQEEGTEPSFDNLYWDHHEPGIYVDIVSGEPLFSSTDKFDSDTGWPSFAKPIDISYITTHLDNKLVVPRTEVRSTIANSHLGHIFNDGPQELGGLRYCINSAALRFIPQDRMGQLGYQDYLYLFD